MTSTESLPILHGQSEDEFDSKVSLSLGWMTHDAHYDFRNFRHKKNNLTGLLESLLTLFEDLSSTDWKTISRRDHRKDGYEILPLSQMNQAIIDGIPEDFDMQVDAVLVFRFNKGEDRLIAIRLNFILYVLGFDFDFSLYHHGS